MLTMDDLVGFEFDILTDFNDLDDLTLSQALQVYEVETADLSYVNHVSVLSNRLLLSSQQL